MEGVKKERIEALNAEFDDKKRKLMEGRSARKSQLTPSNKPTRYSYQPQAPALTTPDPSPGPFQPATSPDPTSVEQSSGSSKKSQPRKKIEIIVPDEESEEDSLRRDI